MSTEKLLQELLTKVDKLLDENKEQKNSIRRLKDRVNEYNSALRDMAASIGVPAPEVKNSEEERRELLWNLSPKQHAYMQLILSDFKHTDIMERFDITLNGSSSVIRKLCKDLGVNDKSQIKFQYTTIFKQLNSKEYLERTQISKSWGEKYGKLSHKDAIKNDPYHEVITKRYRKPNGVGSIYEPPKT